MLPLSDAVSPMSDSDKPPRANPAPPRDGAAGQRRVLTDPARYVLQLLGLLQHWVPPKRCAREWLLCLADFRPDGSE